MTDLDGKRVNLDEAAEIAATLMMKDMIINELVAASKALLLRLQGHWYSEPENLREYQKLLNVILKAEGR